MAGFRPLARAPRRMPLALSVVLATAALSFGWTASGTVRSIGGTPLAGVAVSVKDSAAILATTTNGGLFSIGSSVGVRLRDVADARWSVRMSGRQGVVHALSDGLLGLFLVDGQGRSLWTSSVLVRDGLANFTLPTALPQGAAVLRVAGSSGEHDLAITTGSEGAQVASHIVAPRALATYPVLQFRKSGYRDTSFAMTSESATGLAIAMSDTLPAATTCPAAKIASGDHNQTISVKGVSRKYILHVPAAYTGTSPVPLVVDFHPLAGSASYQSTNTLYKAKTDPEGVVSAYPDGLTGPNGQAWNAKGCCTTADDTAFARALVAEVKTLACIDPQRVYAVGYSMGGGMTHYAACQLADVFAAGAPAAFDLTEQNVPTCHPSRPITMVLFRGAKDDFVKYGGGHSDYVTGMPLDFLGAKASFEKWAELDQCTGTPSAEDANGCSTYSNCAGGVQVTLCTDPNGAHDQGNGAVGWPILKRYRLP